MYLGSFTLTLQIVFTSSKPNAVALDPAKYLSKISKDDSLVIGANCRNRINQVLQEMSELTGYS